MTADDELMMLAAKAAGAEWSDYPDRTPNHWTIQRWPDSTWVHWDPLEDDGDALRLAVKLRFRMSVTLDGVSIDRGPGQALAWERTGVASDEDRCGTAIRRAIVRAAAEIGRNL